MKLACFFAVITLLAAACDAGAAAPVDHGTPSGVYLEPDLHVGERLTDVFSKTVSLRGAGFREHVGRISGSADYVVTAVSPEAITLDSDDRYDGVPASGPVHGFRILADGVTQCYRGKCAPDDQTSGLTFNRLLWGDAPREVSAGSHWTLRIPAPWEIGPAGVEAIRVVSVDPADGEITLVRNGAGAGASSDRLRAEKTGKPLRITTTDGRQLDVRLLPGKATWSGYTTVRKGVIVGDEIMVVQQVKLVARNGETFEGELRAYTLLNLARDTLGRSSARAAPG